MKGFQLFLRIVFVVIMATLLASCASTPSKSDENEETGEMIETAQPNPSSDITGRVISKGKTFKIVLTDKEENSTVVAAV